MPTRVWSTSSSGWGCAPLASKSLSPEGLEWREYFARMREALREAELDSEENEDVLEMIEASRPATAADLNASLFRLIATLTVNAFWSAAQVTRVLHPGKPFKTGERAGESRPDKELTNVFIHAAHPDRRTAAIWYQDGKLMSARIGLAGSTQRVVQQNGPLERFIEGGDA
jgi:hypothetical protein